MKYLLALGCFFSTLGLLATVHTVDNGINSVADYTDLQVAIDEATEGDTLLVKGSYVPYGLLNVNSSSGGSLTLDKRLVIIGEGAHGHQGGPSYEDRLRRTFFGTMTLGEGASGSKFYGLRIYSLVFGLQDDQAESLTDILVSECSIEYFGVDGDDDVLDGFTVLRSAVKFPYFSRISNINNVKFANNILTFRYLDGLRMDVGDNLFVNNVIMISSNSSSSSKVYDQDSEGNDLYEQELAIENVKFLNSIFYLQTYRSRAEERLVFKSSNSELRNCIVMGPTTTRDLLDTDNIEVIISNLSIERAPFVRLPITVTAYSQRIRAETPIADYHLVDGSVGIGNGTDGMNIGIYGGEFPWIDGPVWRYDNEPSIPVVESLKLEKKTVKPGEGLKVRVRARAKGNQ